MPADLFLVSSPAQFAVMAAIAALGGFLRGFSGFGSTMAMVPLFTLIIDPLPAVTIGISLDVVVALPLLPPLFKHVRWREGLQISMGSFAATPVGAWILLVVAASTMRLVIAGAVILAALIMMTGWQYRGRLHWTASVGIGAVSGVSGTAAGIGGPPVMLYVLSAFANAQEARSSILVFSAIMQGFSAAIIMVGAGFGAPVFWTFGSLLPVMAVFAWLGSRTFLIVSEDTFRASVLWLVVILGVAIIVRTILVDG